MKRFLPVLAAACVLAACSNGEEALRAALDEANRCEQTSDCVAIYSKCPLDCYALVHKDEADAMNARIEAFRGNCEYSCIELPPFACIQGKCQFQY